MASENLALDRLKSLNCKSVSVSISDKDKAVNGKHSTKQELRDKCEEIFTLRSQNQKLEQILLKCQNQLNLVSVSFVERYAHNLAH